MLRLCMIYHKSGLWYPSVSQKIFFEWSLRFRNKKSNQTILDLFQPQAHPAFASSKLWVFIPTKLKNPKQKCLNNHWFSEKQLERGSRLPQHRLESPLPDEYCTTYIVQCILHILSLYIECVHRFLHILSLIQFLFGKCTYLCSVYCIYSKCTLYTCSLLTMLKTLL